MSLSASRPTTSASARSRRVASVCTLSLVAGVLGVLAPSPAQAASVTPQFVTTSSNISSTYTGDTNHLVDLNGDQRPDIVIAVPNTGGFRVQLNDGTGGFGAPAAYDTPTGGAGFEVSVGDVNEDGNPDVLARDGHASRLFSYLGVGDGSFTRGADIPVNSATYTSLHLTDLDKDLDLDLLLADDPSGVSVYEGDGTGGFAFKANYPQSTQFPDGFKVISPDLNGDSFPDIVVQHNGPAGTRVILSDGAGSLGFGQPSDYAGTDGRGIEAADFNLDGHTDLAVSSYNSGTSVLVNDGSGVLTSTRIGFNASGSLSSGDFNRDDTPDLALHLGNSVLIYLNDPAAPMSFREAYFDAPGSSNGHSAGDINGDGRSDLVLPSSRYDFNTNASEYRTVTLTNQVVRSVPSAVTGLQGSQAGDGEVELTWGAPASDGGSPVTSYRVTDSRTGRVQDVPAEALIREESGQYHFRVTGLPAGENGFTVLAQNAQGDGESASTSVLVDAAPGSPTIDGLFRGDGRVSVFFTPAPPEGESRVTGYSVRTYDAEGGFVSITHGTTRSIFVTGLQNGVAYTFTVTATNSYGESAQSAPGGPITPDVTPREVRNITTTPGDGQLTFTFDPPAPNGGTPVTGYLVQGYDNSTDRPIRAREFAGSPAVFTGLTNGSSYSFTVAAVNDAGVGLRAVAPGATPAVQVTAPSAPRNVRAEAEDRGALVYFDPPASDGGSPITEYTVIVTDTTDETVAPVRVPALTVPTYVGGLVQGHVYTFVVEATNSVGSTQSAPSAPLTAEAVPGAPANVRAVAGNGEVTVSFAAPASDGGSAITSYTVQVFDAEGSFVTAKSGPSTSILVEGLQNGSAYTFDVYAQNTHGISPTSERSAAVTPKAPATAPGTPQDVTATSPAADAVRISWAAPAADGGSPITGYEVRISSGQSGSGDTVSASTLEKTFTGLVPGTYTVSVAAVNAAGTSDAVSRTVTLTAPVEPSPEPVPSSPAPVEPSPSVSPEPAPTSPAPVEPTPGPSISPTPGPTPTEEPTPEPEPTLDPEERTGYTPLAPVRVVDTRNGTGTSQGSVTNRTVVVTLPELPAGATSAVLNLTATGATTRGHVVAFDANTTPPATSNLNFAPGRVQANLAIVPVGADRKVALSVAGSTQLVVDLVGVHQPGGFHALSPTRAVDTRQQGGPVLGTVKVQLPASVPTSATHVLVNLTATGAQGGGHLTSRPSASAPLGTSSLNYAAGLTQANLVPVRIGADRTVSITSFGARTNIVADVSGYWSEGLRGENVRLVDTRKGQGAAGPLNGVVSIQLPGLAEGTKSVMLNLTAVGGTNGGHAVVYAAGSQKPATSNLNWTRGQTQANLVIVPVSEDGAVTIEVTSPGTVHLVMDMVGTQQ